MKRKVTDLEDFALKQIFRPYQNMCGFGDEALKKLPMKLDEILPFAARHLDWWVAVISRIMRCNFYFPPYIQHELVEVISDYKKNYAIPDKALKKFNRTLVMSENEARRFAEDVEFPFDWREVETAIKRPDGFLGIYGHVQYLINKPLRISL